MASSHRRHAHLHLEKRASVAIPPVQPALVEGLADRTWFQPPELSRRNAASSSTCASSSTGSGCENYVSSATNVTVPIAVGIAYAFYHNSRRQHANWNNRVPLTIALVILLVLHRRHVKKQRIEDANDKHKSLDFGMDPTDAPMMSGKRKTSSQPEMGIAEKSLRRGRGMSMDLGNPYLLPGGLQDSGESIHSLSRNLNNGDDRYRPATTFIPNDTSAAASQKSKPTADDSSSYTASSGNGYKQDGMSQNLLHNAQQMSRSMPPIQRSPEASIQIPPPAGAHHTTLGVSQNAYPSNPRNVNTAQGGRVESQDSFMDQAGVAFRSSNTYLGSFIHSRDPSVDHERQAISPKDHKPSADVPLSQTTVARKSPPPTITVNGAVQRPQRKRSLQPQTGQLVQETTDMCKEQNDQGGMFSNPTSHPVPESRLVASPTQDHNLSMPGSGQSTPFYTLGVMDPELGFGSLEAPGLGMDMESRRISILRPLPPDDPTDNPEQRANRIRSFYKEYFDDSKPAKAYAPKPEVYYEDYGEEFQGDGTVFDPRSGQFVVAQAPYAEPVTRRAMTPPPRGPPRSQGPSRHKPTSSNPQGMPTPRSRAFSSASGRPRPRSRGPPAKVLPPPAPLRTLPTPHLLQEDSFFAPIDFAPPSTYRDRQAGRPDSPRSQSRPFSPQLPFHTPLASAFDELTVMPSP